MKINNKIFSYMIIFFLLLTLIFVLFVDTKQLFASSTNEQEESNATSAYSNTEAIVGNKTISITEKGIEYKEGKNDPKKINIDENFTTRIKNAALGHGAWGTESAFTKYFSDRYEGVDTHKHVYNLWFLSGSIYIEDDPALEYAFYSNNYITRLVSECEDIYDNIEKDCEALAFISNTKKGKSFGLNIKYELQKLINDVELDDSIVAKDILAQLMNIITSYDEGLPQNTIKDIQTLISLINERTYIECEDKDGAYNQEYDLCGPKCEDNQQQIAKDASASDIELVCAPTCKDTQYPELDENGNYICADPDDLPDGLGGDIGNGGGGNSIGSCEDYAAGCENPIEDEEPTENPEDTAEDNECEENQIFDKSTKTCITSPEYDCDENKMTTGQCAYTNETVGYYLNLFDKVLNYIGENTYDGSYQPKTLTSSDGSLSAKLYIKDFVRTASQDDEYISALKELAPTEVKENLTNGKKTAVVNAYDVNGEILSDVVIYSEQYGLLVYNIENIPNNYKFTKLYGFGNNNVYIVFGAGHIKPMKNANVAYNFVVEGQSDNGNPNKMNNKYYEANDGSIPNGIQDITNQAIDEMRKYNIDSYNTALGKIKTKNECEEVVGGSYETITTSIDSEYGTIDGSDTLSICRGCNTNQIQLPKVTNVIDGYTFDGWYTQPNGNGYKISKADDAINAFKLEDRFNAKVCGKDVNDIELVIYANFVKGDKEEVPTETPDEPIANSIEITFNANGGSTTVSSITIDLDKEENIELPTATNPDGEFLGWFTSEDDNATKITSYQDIKSSFEIKAGAKIELIAHWNSTIIADADRTFISIGDKLTNDVVSNLDNSDQELLYSKDGVQYYVPQGVADQVELKFTNNDTGEVETFSLSTAIENELVTMDEVTEILESNDVYVTEVKSSEKPSFIVTTFVNENAKYTSKMTKFYEDKAFAYYFEYPEYYNNTYVITSDGLKYSLDYVLNKGIYSINDLIKNGLNCTKELKEVSSSKDTFVPVSSNLENNVVAPKNVLTTTKTVASDNSNYTLSTNNFGIENITVADLKAKMDNKEKFLLVIDDKNVRHEAKDNSLLQAASKFAIKYDGAIYYISKNQIGNDELSELQTLIGTTPGYGMYYFNETMAKVEAKDTYDIVEYANTKGLIQYQETSKDNASLVDVKAPMVITSKEMLVKNYGEDIAKDVENSIGDVDKFFNDGKALILYETLSNGDKKSFASGLIQQDKDLCVTIGYYNSDSKTSEQTTEEIVNDKLYVDMITFDAKAFMEKANIQSMDDVNVQTLMSSTAIII